MIFDNDWLHQRALRHSIPIFYLPFWVHLTFKNFLECHLKKVFTFFNGPSQDWNNFWKTEKGSWQRSRKADFWFGFRYSTRFFIWVLHPLLPQLRSLWPSKDWVNWGNFYWPTLREVLNWGLLPQYSFSNLTMNILPCWRSVNSALYSAM